MALTIVLSRSCTRSMSWPRSSEFFLDAGKVIEFQPADFASAGVTDSWDTIRSVLPIASLQELTARGHGRTLGVRTDLYRGNLEGTKVSVAWIADLGDREGDPVIEGLLAQSGLALHAH